MKSKQQAVPDAGGDVQPPLAAARIRLEVAPGGPLICYADRVRLQQIAATCAPMQSSSRRPAGRRSYASPRKTGSPGYWWGTPAWHRA